MGFRVDLESPVLGVPLEPRSRLERGWRLPSGIRGFLPPSRLPRQECEGSAFSGAAAAVPGSSQCRPFLSCRINWFCLSNWESSSC